MVLTLVAANILDLTFSTPLETSCHRVGILDLADDLLARNKSKQALLVN